MCLNSNGLKVRMFFILEVNFSGDGDLKRLQKKDLNSNLCERALETLKSSINVNN